MTTATVRLWGTTIGYVSMDHGERFARFEYDPDFAAAGIDVAPLQMPAKARRIYQFRDLDVQRLKTALATPTLVDLRNIWDPETMRSAGFTYTSIGRP